MSAQSRRTIEHFRPKRMSEFPELAYSWENLFYCCDRCQQKSMHQSFKEGTLKPDQDGYSFNRYFTYNAKTGELELNKFSSSEEKENAINLIERYSLNENSIVNARKERYEDFILLGDKARQIKERPYRFCYI